MLSKTITEGLAPYTIGPKLRALRRKKSMGLEQLSRHTGLSPAMLSKLERGKLFPTLPTLLRIALVFSVGLDYFFTDESRRHVVAVVRGRDRKRFPERPGTAEVSYLFESLDYTATERKLNAFLARFRPIDEKGLLPHQHPSAEFLYLLQGTLTLRIGSASHMLEAGDSIYFDSNVPHTYRRTGPGPCSALVVTVP